MSVLITTSLGDLVFDLYTDKCPLACQNFLKLCKIKYYHGSRFHYVKKNFIAVAGDRSGIGEDGDSIYKFLIGEHYRFFDNEIHPCLNHSKAGTIGMLSGGENLNASRFYITLVDNILSLDGKYTVFGEVSEGFDTLAKIADTCVDAENIALENIRIRHTDLLEDPFPDPPELAELIPDASPEGKPKEEVSVNGRREYDLVMTDEELSPQSQKEVIYREAGGYSSVLESIRKPPDNSLFIWNLNPVTEGDGLDEIFSRFGTVSMAQVFRDFESHDSLGCAIICFECEEACKKACLKMNNASLDGRIIRIDFTHNYHWKKEGLGPYDARIKRVEEEIEVLAKSIDNLCGTREIESETGLAPRSQWDLVSDEQMIKRAQPLLVGRCTKVMNQNTDDAKYVIDLKKRAKFVVGLGDKVSPTDIEEGMRVGVDSKTYQIQISLPPKVDLSVVMMIVEEKPDVTYNDVGGCKEQIEKIREIVELPMLHPEKFVTFGIDPPKGALCYGPPGTGKTLVARAVANRTNACFIRVIGSELVQKNVGEGARIVRELFQIARSKKACIVFFDEVDAIGGARFEEGTIGNDNEAHRTLLEIANQLDGFDARGNIKVLMATNRPDTLDPALVRHGRLDRNVEFCLPDREGRTQIFKIHTRTMKCERDIRFELLALLCPNSTGADIKSVCIEAGLHAIGAKRKSVSETDFMAAVHKVIKGPKYKSPYI